MLEIELLQVALGTRSSLSHVPTDKEWDELYAFADRHAIVGVMFEGIERLPQKQVPYMDLIMEWVGQAEYLKTQKGQFDEVMAEFASLMSTERIPYVVFKGLAVASQYPHPELRTMGDIDFYVPPTDFERTVGVIERELVVEIKKDDIDKHYSFDWKDIRFEMHYQMETFGRNKHQVYFSQLCDICFDIDNSLSYFDLNGVQIPMLPPMQDLILVFKHWMTHFIGEGVGLRQTTDLAVLVKNYQSKIDAKILKEHLSAIGYLRAFDVMVALVQRYYGFEWPKYWNASPKSIDMGKALSYADQMMTDIMKNGNFGRSNYKYKEGTKKRLETTWRFFSHCFRYFWLAPSDIACLVPKRIAISIKAH